LINFRFAFLGVLAILALALLSACGGGDGDSTIDVGDGEVNLSDDLPDEFPDDFPIYDGADFQGSYQGESQGVSGLVALWETDDSAGDVLDYYESELEGSSWSVESSGNTGAEGGFLAARNSDTSEVAAVYVGSADGKTSISVIISDDDSGIPDGGDDSGDDGSDDSGDDSSDGSDDGSDDNGSSDDGSSGNADLPEETDLPDDFPSNVPLPDDIRVTNSSSLTTGGVNTFFVEFYSEQSADEIADFFKAELPSSGWTESLSSESGGEIFLNFGTGESGVTIIITESPTDGYRLVTLSVVGA
jgi:hypothetical protein